MKDHHENKDYRPDRRRFCSGMAVAAGAAFLIPQPFSNLNFYNMINKNPNDLPTPQFDEKSIIGPYGPWLSAQRGAGPGRWSFRHTAYKNPKKWRKKILPKVEELVASPAGLKDFKPKVKTLSKYDYDGLEIEELEWALPFGNPTRAVLLKPKGAKGPLPAILGLHDHGGNKYFGLRKITKTKEEQHPMMVDHQIQYYEGRAWANDIAKRGYVVLVHDTFTFASRRVRFDEMKEIPWGDISTKGKTDDDPENPENVKIYNQWAAAHEHVMAKSLFSGGTTWPGLFLAEDQIALGILADRQEVDSSRIGAAGLSGGGLRSVYLGGMDDRIACVICVGFMSTWDDFLLNKSFTHTWMTYTPVLPAHLDFSEILSLRMPKPTMVLNDNEDGLYTLPEMKKAARILEDNFQKAGVSDRLSCRFYPGPHKFDIEMQNDAFDWFDRWLK